MNCKLLFFVGSCVILLAGCSAENQYDVTGTGQVSPVLTADFSVPLSTDPAVLTTTTSQPETQNFAVSIIREDGSLFKSWDTFSEFPENMKFPLGSFVFKASYGNIDKEGFDMPYFEGSEPFQVFDKQNTDISVTCTLSNAKVSLVYTEAFKNYFSDFAVALKTEKDNSIIFSKDETREAYVKPGKIILQMSLVKPDGSSMAYSPEIFIAESCKHYRISFDVNEGNIGGAALSIVFDENTELDPVTINLADGSLSMKPPFTTSMGFESGKPLTVKEFDASLGDINTLITAPSGFVSCTLTTSSAYLQSKGWPSEVELSALTAEQKTLFASMGLRLKGFENKDKMAYVDFSDLVPRLEYVEGSADHTFTLKATDVQGKMADEVTLAVTTQPRSFALQTPDAVSIGSTQAVIPVLLDGDPLLVAVNYKDDNGQMQACTVSHVESAGNQTYNFTVQLPVGNRSKEISAIYHNLKNSAPVMLEAVTPPYTISRENEGDVWAKKATITVTAENPEHQTAVMEYLTLYEGGTKVNFTQQGDNKIFISDLTAGTEYNFKTTCTDYAGNTEFSNMLSITTESELAVPNGDFETLTQTINISSIDQGGKWSDISHWREQQTTTSFNVSEPTGWASVNAKTCCYNSANAKNTWFVEPSTFNTSSSQSGENAMTLRNVGWDLNGHVPGKDTETGSHPYSKKTPDVIAHTSVGKLFLGTYSFVASTLGETYTEGVAFTSRPDILKGYYKYINDSQDTAETGYVSVKVLSGDVVIGEGFANLKATSSFKEFSVPISYSNKILKATELEIMIASSNHIGSIVEETANVKVTKYTSESEQLARGAELTVDNLTFSY